MTQTEQNEAIATFLGYVKKQNKIAPHLFTWFTAKGRQLSHWTSDPGYYLPAYTKDLNAMHKAETATFPLGNMLHYLHELESIVAPQHSLKHPDSRYAILTATAAQRAEAFLKTLNLWKT